MIPHNSDFSYALESLSVGNLSSLPSDARSVACKPVIAKQSPGTLRESNAIEIGFYRPSKLSINALIAKVQHELAANGHVLCDPTSHYGKLVAVKILALAVVSSETASMVLNNLNYILAATTDTNVGLFAVVNVPAEDSEVYRFEDFTFGRLNSERFEHLCTHAGSDYFNREGPTFNNRLAVVREMTGIRTFSFAGSRLDHSHLVPQQNEFIYRILDDYHADIAEGLFEKFRNDMSIQQAVSSALGVGEITQEFIWQFTSLARLVAVFTRVDANQGWVVPIQLSPYINTVSPRSLSSVRAEVDDSFRLHDFGKHGLDGVIHRYCVYLHASAGHERQNRIEEALIHKVFALDLLLGGKAGDALTLVLSERVAWLTHVALDADLNRLVKFISDAYNMRSGYAHRGERGGLGGGHISLQEQFERMSTITNAVLAATCWARQQLWCKDRNSWLARIDLLRAKHLANESVKSTAAELGLGQIRRRENTTGFILNWSPVELA